MNIGGEKTCLFFFPTTWYRTLNGGDFKNIKCNTKHFDFELENGISRV